MTDNQSLYQQLGVDPRKASVRETYEAMVNNAYPNAFVNICHDLNQLGFVFTKHSDGDGSKFVQRILHYLETDDETILQGSVDDAFSMNTSDISASGFSFGKWVLTQTININGFNVPKNLILKQNAIRLAELLALYKQKGFDLHFMGGETADLPDQTTSIVYDMDIYAEALESELIIGNVRAGDKIWGLASDGQAVWENEYNSGIMSNGLTMARTMLMHPDYTKKYPFLIRSNGAYQGRYKINDQPEVLNGMAVSQAILSPTRQWAIFIKDMVQKIYDEDVFHKLHGIVINTGGGATKIRHLGKGIKYFKKMPDFPPDIFHLIQEESQESWRNMYETFNMGVGIDIIGEDDLVLDKALAEVSQQNRVKLYELGHCESADKEENQIILETFHGTFSDY